MLFSRRGYLAVSLFFYIIVPYCVVVVSVLCRLFLLNLLIISISVDNVDFFSSYINYNNNNNIIYI